MEDIGLCFVICPIGKDGSDIRIRSDRVFSELISPVVESCGYRILRADQIQEPGLITSQVLRHLVEDALIIGDLTGHNPNVFYELAVRHAVHKPVIHIIDAFDPIPFDVAGSRTITFTINDATSVLKAQDNLKAQIESIKQPNYKVENPLSVALARPLLLRRVSSGLTRTIVFLLLTLIAIAAFEIYAYTSSNMLVFGTVARLRGLHPVAVQILADVGTGVRGSGRWFRTIKQVDELAALGLVRRLDNLQAPNGEEQIQLELTDEGRAFLEQLGFSEEERRNAARRPASLKTATIPAPSLAAANIPEVSQASYGRNCRADQSGNATHLVKTYVAQNCTGKQSCSIPVQDAAAGKIGDPCSGVPKDFDVTYLCGDHEKMVHVAGESTGKTAFISCAN